MTHEIPSIISNWKTTTKKWKKHTDTGLATSSNRWERYIDPVCFTAGQLTYHLQGYQVSGHLLAISLRMETDIGVSCERMGPG